MLVCRTGHQRHRMSGVCVSVCVCVSECVCAQTMNKSFSFMSLVCTLVFNRYLRVNQPLDGAPLMEVEVADAAVGVGVVVWHSRASIGTIIKP